MINPKLNVGDRVVLLHMDGETSVSPGEQGTVIAHSEVFGDDQYTVSWDSGSKLALISSVDLWDTPKDKKKSNPVKERVITKKSITEIDDQNRVFLKNIDIFKHFNMRFLKSYLMDIRESGITNMFGAAPYLYMGKDRIEHEFKYKDIDEDLSEKVLERADQSQSEMINGTIKALEAQGKEESLANINKYISRYATMVVETYFHLF
jgi:hypothetical protein